MNVGVGGWGVSVRTLNVTRVVTHLLHEHVDVSLRGVQHVSVRMFQSVHRDFHRLAVDVDPTGGAAGQERPGIRRLLEILNFIR